MASSSPSCIIITTILITTVSVFTFTSSKTPVSALFLTVTLASGRVPGTY